MNTETILRYLENSGFRIVGSDGVFIRLEDPTCFIRSLADFIDIAWIVITAFAGVLLFGWGVALIRGAKGDIIKNIRNLFLIFSVLAASRPIVNAIWGGDLFGMGCKVIQVPVAQVNTIIDSAKLKLKTQEEDALFEKIDIQDSAISSSTPNIMGEIDVQIPTSPIEEPKIVSSGTGPSSLAPSITPVKAVPKGTGSASISGKQVSFIGIDGRRHTKIGGSLAWRNNNPGNITCGAGLIFDSIACNGRFLVFPGESVGARAIVLQLKNPKYQSKTVGGAIARWAPPNENNTAAYQRSIEQGTGLSLNTPMSSLSDAQLTRVAQVIKKIEGWIPGKEIIE